VLQPCYHMENIRIEMDKMKTGKTTKEMSIAILASG
jgi:hypothetical protein